MARLLLALLLGLTAGCNGVFGQRTSEEDRALNSFAEARHRAATYYDGKDYTRAALQFQEALKYRPKHVATRLGFAYSLMYANTPSSLLEAERQFGKIGKQRDLSVEVKRIYGLGLTSLKLAADFDRRSRLRESKGRIDLAGKDRDSARRYAKQGLGLFRKVIEIDAELAARKVLGPQRVSASLQPDAHVAMAGCEIILGDAQHLEPFARAEEHIEAFAKTAANARRFWEQRRERLLVTDPLERSGAPGAKTLGADERVRYEDRIAGTIRQEVSVRRSLMLTYLYLNLYRKAIAEGTKILELDPSQNEIYLMRGNAYAYLQPPDYPSAVRDLKEYRRRLDPSRQTDERVRLNRRIRTYEGRIRPVSSP